VQGRSRRGGTRLLLASDMSGYGGDSMHGGGMQRPGSPQREMAAVIIPLDLC